MAPFHNLEAVINTIADPVFVKDRQHRWILLNDAYCRFMGFRRDQLLGKSDHDFFPTAEADVFWEKDEDVFRSGEENTNEELFTDATGQTHIISTKKCRYTSPDGTQFIVGSIRDVTDINLARRELEAARDRLEVVVAARTAELASANEALRQQIIENQRTADELRQSQKMEAIGRLAGGIAHDFNNILNVILGYAALIEERSETDRKLREAAGQIATAAEKAASLTRQLLIFSRKQVLEPEILTLDDILETMGRMLPSMVGEDVQLAVWPGAPLGYVKADRGQIEQVIMNVAVNARDAMAEGGRLTISSANLDISDEENESSSHDVPPGQYVLLTVSDTGKGMDPETQAHIFEPFFTTKDRGKGTGLGLSTVYAIVSHSGGHIRVHSETNQGTTLKIYLPRVTEGAPVISTEDAGELPQRASGTILLVEDQANLRTLLREVLQAKGYLVLEADTGKRAIALARKHPGRIDLLVTDIIMPGMRGWIVGQRVAVLRPGIKVLYMSGHTDTDLEQQEALLDRELLLEKPFRPEVLLRKVHDIFSRDRNALAG